MSDRVQDPSDDAVIEAWCRGAANGDADALERLWLTYSVRLLGFAERKIGVDWRDRIEGLDLLQEAFVDIAKQISGFAYSGTDSFYHWTSRIVSSKFTDKVRYWHRSKRDVRRTLRYEPAERGSRYDGLIDRVLRDTQTPSQALRREDATAAVLSCLTRLSAAHSIVIRRVYLHGEPLAAVAADLGKSEDAVRHMVGRAVDRLSDCVGRASQYLSGRD